MYSKIPTSLFTPKTLTATALIVVFPLISIGVPSYFFVSAVFGTGSATKLPLLLIV